MVVGEGIKFPPDSPVGSYSYKIKCCPSFWRSAQKNHTIKIGGGGGIPQFTFDNNILPTIYFLITQNEPTKSRFESNK